MTSNVIAGVRAPGGAMRAFIAHLALSRFNCSSLTGFGVRFMPYSGPVIVPVNLLENQNG
jgi:hypothetical protein